MHKIWEIQANISTILFSVPTFLFFFISEWHLEIRACALRVLIWYWDVIVSRPSQWLGHTCKHILTMETHISLYCLFSFFHLSVFFSSFLSICHLFIYQFMSSYWTSDSNPTPHGSFQSSFSNGEKSGSHYL